MRDLLALDTPIASLLPVDDMSYGFDNIAGVLRITPSLLDRYMVAARQISRMAVGDPALPLTAETFRLKADLSQDESFDSLPLGTRGGTSIVYQFPLDADYSIKVEPLGGGNDPHDLEVSIDGARVKLFRLQPRSGMAPGQGYDSEGEAYDVRIPVKAGPHVVAVTFVKKSSALIESVRQPFLAPHAEGAPRTQPAVASVTITGPYDVQGVSETPSRQRIFSCRPTTRAAESDCAKQILATLARRAYRRPVTPGEVAVLLKFYTDGRAKHGFDGGVELALRRLLVSPEFLFRVESDPSGVAAGATYAVSDLELASRLSFFLWSSIPDDELLNAAVKGTLRKPGVLEQQVRRMLADERSDALSANFAGQWLQLRTVEGTSPNEFLFPNFGENLRRDFRRETELFFQSVVRENRSLLDFLTADYTFVNERLAKHYGIPDVYGSQFRRVTLGSENAVRRGLLGKGAFLATTSKPERTSPVTRGKWIMTNILGMSPPDPPADVPPLKPKSADAAGNTREPTMRQKMLDHRVRADCIQCHSLMDPIGFSLENFDGIGLWRSHDESTPVDASAQVFDGSKIDGPAGLRAWLVTYHDQFVEVVAEKLLTYALGRGVEYQDMPLVRAIARDAGRDGNKFSALVLGVVRSKPFQMNMKQDAPATTSPTVPNVESRKGAF